MLEFGITYGRSARAFYENVVANLINRDIPIFEILPPGLTYADGNINTKLGNLEELTPRLPRMHVFVLQSLQNPFALRPDHYISNDLVELYKEVGYDYEKVRDFLEIKLKGLLSSYSLDKTTGRLKDEALTGLHNLLKDGANHHEIEGYLSKFIQARSVNDELWEFISMVNNLKERGARYVSGVFPFLEGRSDTNRHGEGNQTALKATIFRATGLDNIITWRRHSDMQKKLFEGHNVSFYDVYDIMDGRSRYINKLVEYLIEHHRDELPDLVVVGPDEGSMEETIVFAEKLTDILNEMGLINFEIPYTIFKKEREGQIHKIKSMEILDGCRDLEGKIIIFRDDIIDTSGTYKTFIIQARDIFKIKTSIMVDDHTVLSRPGISNIETSQERGLLEKVIAAATVIHPEKPDFVEYLPVDDDFAYVMMQVFEDSLIR